MGSAGCKEGGGLVVAGARQALLVGALQPRGRAAARVRLGRLARQAVVAQHRALRRHAGGQGDPTRYYKSHT